MTTVLQVTSISVLSFVLILFCVALIVEATEMEEIAKLMVMPMLAVGIIVTGYGIFKSVIQG